MSNEEKQGKNQIVLKGLEFFEVGSKASFRVIYTEGMDPLVMQCIMVSNTLELLDDDGGLVQYLIESSSMRECEPETFMFVANVRKYTPPWRSNT